MRKHTLRFLTVFLAIIITLCTVATGVYALSWDGSSQGGGGKGDIAGPNGYAVRTTGDNCVGYRFSIVNKSGANKVSKVIDVFRSNSVANSALSSNAKFNTKYNKKQLINNQNAGFSTSKNSKNCYKETDMGFASKLPAPSGMGTWQNNTTNLNKILSNLGAGNITSLKNGDKILVEPLYDVRLESVYHALTVTEIAIYGKHILGVTSDGGRAPNSGSWGFISNYTNMHYPNALFTPDGQGLWSGVKAATAKITFYNIINQGYGVGIAYTETKSDFSPSLFVERCEAWPGNKSTRNNNHYGISRGNSFANWTYGHGYPKKGDTVWFAIYFPSEKENCYVKQTVWIDGGDSVSRNVWSNSNNWFDVQLNPKTVSEGRSYYTVKARADWIDSSGKVLKYGTEKSFYIPIKPTLHRYQVTMYDYAGNVAAQNGMTGLSGKVYVGQNVKVKYTFTADNTWTSIDDLSGSMHKWNGSKWIHASGKSVSETDLSLSKKSMNKSSPVNAYSTLGYVRVPDNSGSGSNVMPFVLTSQWNTDGARTHEESRITIPVVKADIELYDIKLIGEDGYYADPQNLTVGEKVTVRYLYKNNTDCKVYVEGYNDDKSQIKGIYAIPAGGIINVDGASFTVPDKRSFSIWGGVYLEGAGIHNTSCELNEYNNAIILTCKSKHPLTLTPITPNAKYREGTDVVTSYWLNNGSTVNYTQKNNITVRFRVYKADNTLIMTATKTQAVVPANDKNLIYFKWTVPKGLLYKNITIKADILDGGTYYNLVSKNYNTVPYLKFETPDTQYEEKMPSGFTTTPVPSQSSEFASWWEYSYENGKFVKKTYGIGINTSGTNEIIPKSGATAEIKNGQWIMKSGYGFEVKSAIGTMSLNGYLTPLNSMHTGAQYSYITLPEYGYSFSQGKCVTLEKSDGYWILPINRNYGRYHFTPLWFPDGNYTANITQSDMWTPSGMISASCPTNTVVIKDSAYDDWYIGRQ